MHPSRLIVMLAGVALAVPVCAASFDCKRAASKPELLICQDDEISRLDGQLSEKYKLAVRFSSQPDQLKVGQRTWLNNIRDRCADKPCLVAAYQNRMKELDEASVLIQSGIYLLDATPPAITTNPGKDAENESRDEYQTRNEHAMPQDAHIEYAVVSRDEQRNLNKVLFVTSPGYQFTNDFNRPCSAYAFPNWNNHTEAVPFCRSGFMNEEGMFAKQDQAFVFSWPTVKKLERQVNVPPKRKPTAQEVGGCVMGVCSGEAYGYTVNHYVATNYADRFSLKATKPYRDILYLPKDIQAYAAADIKATTSKLKVGSYVAVIAVEPEWYEIDRVAPNGEVLHAWLKRDDLLDAQWVTQKATTDQFSFSVAVKGSDAGVVAVAIKVIDRKTELPVQTIYDFESDETSAPAKQLLQVVDANFDHYPDIRIFCQSGGAGPNNTDNFFLFNPKSGRFEFDEQLSALPQIGINSRQQTITTGSRDGCCSHSSQVYRYVGGVLTLVEEISINSLLEDPDWQEVTTGKLKGGKMVYRKSRERVPD